MKISSAAFINQDSVPPKYTCEGANISPALSWQDIPGQAKSVALTVEDPDAPVGTWVHWIVYNIPPDAKGLPEAVSAVKNLPNGAQQGENSFHKIGYGGPCPPPGHGPHRYFFRLYALDTLLDIRPGASRKELDDAMKEHILSRAELVGRYERQVMKKKSY